MTIERMHLVISGKVQGVFYRKFAQEQASRLNLRGFVSNLDSGEVELVAEGERTKLEELAAWCRKGPAGAIVNKIDIQWFPAENVFTGFKVIYP